MRTNTQLFFKINNLAGRGGFLDKFSKIGAKQAVILAVIYYVSADVATRYPSERQMFWPLAFFGAFWALGWVLNMFIGMIIKKPRPYVTFPQAKTFFKPLLDWKTFPSDHAMTVFLLFFMALIFSLPFAWVALVLALWICWGRIYCGVHYPLDMLGGATMAFFCASLAYLILHNVF